MMSVSKASLPNDEFLVYTRNDKIWDSSRVLGITESAAFKVPVILHITLLRSEYQPLKR